MTTEGVEGKRVVPRKVNIRCERGTGIEGKKKGERGEGRDGVGNATFLTLLGDIMIFHSLVAVQSR